MQFWLCSRFWLYEGNTVFQRNFSRTHHAVHRFYISKIPYMHVHKFRTSNFHTWQVTFKSYLKANLGLGQEGYQHAVIDEFLCMVTDCALGTDVCQWMFNYHSRCTITFIMQPDTDCEMQCVKQHSAARKHNLRAQELRLYKTVPHAGHWHI